jgi:hypothetical protein
MHTMCYNHNMHYIHVTDVIPDTQVHIVNYVYYTNFILRNDP